MSDERLEKLEAELTRLKAKGATGETPVLGIAAFLAFCGYCAMISKLPLPNAADEAKVVLGIGAGFVGALVFVGAIAFVQFSLKALVEIATVLAVLFNAIVAAVAWVVQANLLQLVASWNVVNGDDLMAATVALVVGGLFVTNVLLAIVLFPLARIAGSSLAD